MEQLDRRANQSQESEKHHQDDDAINNPDNENEENEENDDQHPEDDTEVEVPETREKRGNFIFRQELKSFTPECNAKNALCCNFILVIIFAGAGRL